MTGAEHTTATNPITVDPAPEANPVERITGKIAADSQAAVCAGLGDGACQTDPPAAGRSPIITAGQIAAATAHLQLPAPDPMIGPDPSWNEWNALAVGLPVWYWTNRAPEHTTLTHDGITITIHATASRTAINPGDGTAELTCSTTTPYDRSHTTPGTPSPDCGHTYTTTGTMIISATTHWTITWAAAGQTGTLTATRTGTRTVDIITLNTVIDG